MSKIREMRQQFIHALAEYLAGTNQVEMSTKLRLCSETAEAKTWAALRGLTPLFGYPTVEEAEKILDDFLAIDAGHDVKKAWARVCADRKRRAEAKKAKEASNETGR